MAAVLAALVATVILLLGAFLLFGPQITHCGDMRRVKALADVRGIGEAIDMFKRDCGAIPTSLDALVAGSPAAAECTGKYDPRGYLDRMPIDPWGHPYIYRPDREAYLIRSFGADGMKGGKGDAADIDNLEP